MSDLARVGVAIDADLLEKFDEQIGQRGYANRSEAVRDLIRDSLIRENVSTPDAEVVGTLDARLRSPRAPVGRSTQRIST
jgi:CopG family nickel-responsive transcriptional regulator